MKGAWQSTNFSSRFANRQSEIGNASITVTIAFTHRLFLLLAASLLFEGNVFMKFLAQVLEPFACRMLKLLQSLGVGLFDFLRHPKSFGKVETNDTDDHYYE